MQATTVSPPLPPSPPAPELPQAPAVAAPTPAPQQGVASAQSVYQAFRAHRRELQRQLESLEGRRSNLSGRLRDNELNATDRAGLEARLAETDQRILSIEKQIAAADQSVANAAAVPGATVDPPSQRSGPPEEVFVLGGVFMFVVLLPLSIAYARRIWRRGAAVTQLPKELSTRLTTLEQGVDAIAVEVERIGEGQRYVTQLMNDAATSRLVGAGAAEPIPVRERDALHGIPR